MTLPDPDSSWAYLVGVSSFPGRPDLQALPQVSNNLTDLRHALTSDHGGFLPAQCLVESDPKNMGVLAANLARLTKVATDTLLVYYAGHGCLDDDGKLHLTFPDSTRDGFGFNTLEIAVLRRLLARSTARRRVLVLDCCYSGNAIDLMSDLDSQVISELPDIEGGFTITSSPRSEVSKALVGEHYTVFTGELIDVLRGGVPDGSELLSLNTVFEVLRRRLRHRGMPEPKSAGTNAAGELALVRNATWTIPIQQPVPPRLPTLPQRLTVTGEGVATGAAEMAAMFERLLGPDRWEQAVNTSDGIVLSDDPRVVAELMTSPHPEVQAGLRLMQSLVERVHRLWGDGTVTAVLVAAALINDLAALRGSAVAGEVAAVAADVLETLERESRPCKRADVVHVLATITKRQGILQMAELPGVSDWREVDFVHDEVDSVQETWACVLDAHLAWPDQRAVAGAFERPRISWHAEPIVDPTPLVELTRAGGARPIVLFTPTLDPPVWRMLRLNAERGRLAVVQFGSALTSAKLAEAYQDLAETTGGGYQPGTFGGASAIEFGTRTVRLLLPEGDDVRCRVRRAFLRSLEKEDSAWLAQRLAFLERKRVTVTLADRTAVVALRRACRVGDKGPARVVRGGGMALRDAGAAISAKGPVAKAWAAALRVPVEHLPESGHGLLDPLPVVRGIVEAVRDVALEYLGD